MGRLTETKTMQTTEKKEGTVYKLDSGQEIKLTPQIVKNYICPNLTNSELSFFLNLCKARKLNPFTKEVYVVKFGANAAQIVISKDFLEKRAIQNPKYNGKEVGVIIKDYNGNIVKRVGSFFDKEDEQLLGAWCKVFRKDWEHPVYVEVNLDEYIQKKSDGTPNKFWAEKPATMITKVARAQALREAFVDEFAQLYEAEELGIDESPQQPLIVEEETATASELIEEPAYDDTLTVDEIF